MTTDPTRAQADETLMLPSAAKYYSGLSGRAHDVRDRYIAELEAALRQRLAADAQPLEAKGWMPIETAPKEGSFLVYLPEESAHKRVQPMHVRASFSTIGDTFAFDKSEPTHWQPLPPPPTQSEGSRG